MARVSKDEMFVCLVADHDEVVLGATCAIALSSSREKTMPVGLCGEFAMIIRVRGVIAERNASASRGKSDTGTRRGNAQRNCHASGPAIAMIAAYRSKYGSKTITSS